MRTPLRNGDDGLRRSSTGSRKVLVRLQVWSNFFPQIFLAFYIFFFSSVTIYFHKLLRVQHFIAKRSPSLEFVFFFLQSCTGYIAIYFEFQRLCSIILHIQTCLFTSAFLYSLEIFYLAYLTRQLVHQSLKYFIYMTLSKSYLHR